MNDWKETTPGRSERPIDSLEAFYIATSNLSEYLGKEHLSLSFGVRIEHQLVHIVDALKNAWSSLRYEHPKLAATAEGPNLVYHVAADQAAIDAYLAETFIINSFVRSSAELFPSLSTPPPRTILYYLPTSSEIVVHSAHWRLDGMGSLHLLSLLLDHLAAPPVTLSNLRDTEIVRLTPGLDTVLLLDAQPADSALAVCNNALANFASHQPAMRLPFLSDPPIPSIVTRRHQLIFPKEFSDAIIAASKAGGVSVTAAIHAALVSALKTCKEPDDRTTNHASWCAFSVRRKLPDKYQGVPYAVAGAHTGWPLALASTDFARDVTIMQQFYNNSLASSDAVASLRYLHGLLTTQLNQPLPPGSPIPVWLGLNSLGIVDRIIQSTYGEGAGHLKVHDFWLGNTVMTLDIWVHLWTWKGQITLSALYNAGVYEDGIIQGFLKQIKQVLATELSEV